MPVTIWVIGIAIFAQGTSELMLAGLLPELSADLGVTIPQAGLLVSVFALGMLVGAPVLAVITLRWPRRRAMLAFLAIFVLGHVAGALTDSFRVLVAVRFIAAFVYAGFWAVGAGTAMSLVAPDRRGRAMSIVAGGLTIATVIGLPAGAWLGQNLGWRWAFWAVAALSTLAAGAVLAAVPTARPGTVPLIGDELRGLAVPRLWLSYAMTAVGTAALLGTFTYLGAMLITTSGLGSEWVPVVLFSYGIGALAGMAVGGYAADRWPRGVLLVGFTALCVVLIALAIASHHALTVSALTVLLGLTGFVTNPALNSRVFALGASAPTLTAAGTTSAFNVGIALGPWLAGMALTAGFDYPVVPWIGAGLAIGALALFAVDAAMARGGHPRATPADRRPVPGLTAAME
ncbi:MULTISPECIES: Cmx/CmrA family chloramphenicol efflux MFS transporter [unclassified Mycolicibacterium]|uniref:Cmx/CmrA family chloramphenicol efflux MFS transporter n=1 Tax=unclassified Mycolicibacterium TaxID=2636767 RepID=UPI0012DD6433|nr:MULTISPECIES: Cmx/CmrA family chloramphenicol efflux MFS transporter [unclassified Mycolicibacterium]MUL80924.1 MFS transporter [Mycolicibacterium sp. CBMA 329]MUL86690.1 MFS transporter [Mycolicibacterium sp. CBMA 331]MUM02893.1 MFS transporter [Mycolicibacterium sp. CBMA 334]MUM28849.1 MFS transporter [Mycolicibacterium sp. CBMA 295]MUM36987.1 MFS transporter [Mycolicibacterium sp. CBMA 247]